MSCCGTDVLRLSRSSRFAVQWVQDAPILTVGGAGIANITGYAVTLRLMLGDKLAQEVSGVIVSPVTPFAVSFEDTNITDWRIGEYAARIAIQEPSPPVGASPWVEDIDVSIEVTA